MSAEVDGCYRPRLLHRSNFERDHAEGREEATVNAPDLDHPLLDGAQATDVIPLPLNG